MERVLVTGANGMLASNMIDELLKKGYHVVGMLRNRSSYRGVMNEHLDLFEGDFKNEAHLKAAIKGCSGVFHVAAITDQSKLHLSEYESVNCKPLHPLLQTAIEQGVKRFVFVSTANTIGNGTWENPVDETTPWNAPLTQSLYAQSKVEAEKIVRSYGDRIETVIVNPTFMIGRFGTSTGSNQILDMAQKVTFCTAGGKNFIDVEEAARGIVLAYERGRNGENYLICGENISFKDFFRRFPKVSCVVVIPTCLVLLIGCLGNLLRMMGCRVAFSLSNMKILCVPDAYTGKKAEQELGFKPHPLKLN